MKECSENWVVKMSSNRGQIYYACKGMSHFLFNVSFDKGPFRFVIWNISMIEIQMRLRFHLHNSVWFQITNLIIIFVLPGTHVNPPDQKVVIICPTLFGKYYKYPLQFSSLVTFHFLQFTWGQDTIAAVEANSFVYFSFPVTFSCFLAEILCHSYARWVEYISSVFWVYLDVLDIA